MRTPFEWIQRLLGLAASLGVILIAGGYMIVNGALMKVHMPTYNVVLSQYIAAGGFFLLTFLLNTAVSTFGFWYVIKMAFHSAEVEQFLDEYLPGCWQPLAFVTFLILVFKQFFDWGLSVVAAII